jgi:hypothetical protein
LTGNVSNAIFQLLAGTLPGTIPKTFPKQAENLQAIVVDSKTQQKKEKRVYK